MSPNDQRQQAAEIRRRRTASTDTPTAAQAHDNDSSTRMHDMSAESTLFQRLDAQQYTQLTQKALSAELAAPPTPAKPASHTNGSVAVQRHSSRHSDAPLDIHTAAHVFELLARYTQANRVSKYLELDVSGIWEQVKRQSRYSLTTLTEAEKSEHDAIQFERGDREMRVKLVLTELRQLARAMRRRHKEKDRPSGAPSTANTPVPPRPLVLSRNNSLQSPPYGGATATAAAAVPSFYSALLTHPLFASELDTIVPVLYLRARNASSASSGLTDEEDEEGAEGLGGGGGGGGGGGADDDSPMRRFELPPDVDADSDERMGIEEGGGSESHCSDASLFMPLRELVLVLLHQGPQHGTWLLALLAYAKPCRLAVLLDVCLDLLRQHLVQLYERMHGLTVALQPLVHSPAQLSSAALSLWQQAHAAVHSAPLTTLHAVLLSLASLAPAQVGLFVRVRIAAMMEELRLAPPVLSLPPAPSVSAAAPPAAPSAATTAAAAPPPSPSPAANASTPSRNRGAPLPAPVHVGSAAAPPRSTTPLNGLPASSSSSAASAAAAAAASVPASSFVTGPFMSVLLQHCWAPLSHFLPRLVLALTQAVVRDEAPFFASIFARLNSPPWVKNVDAAHLGGEKTAAHWVVEFVRDHKMGEEYADHVAAAQQAAATAAATAAASAAAAAHAASVKARAAAEAAAAEPRGKRKNPESRARDRERTKAASTLALQQQQQQQQQQQKSSAASSRTSPAPNLSPSLSSHKSSSALGQAIPSLAAQSPQKLHPSQPHPSALSSPTLQPVPAPRELLFTPLAAQRHKSGGFAAAGSHHASLSSGTSGGDSSAQHVYRSGGVDVLRSRLFARMQHAASEYESRLPHHAGLAAPLRGDTAARTALAAALSELLRLVKLYSLLQLYCNWQVRPRELEQVHHLIPAAAHAAAVAENISCSSTLLALLVQLHQFVLALLCITPQATLHAPASSPQWGHTLATLLRMKSWMGALQAAQMRLLCSSPVAAGSLASMLDSRVYGCDNFLFQLGLSAQHPKSSELLFLLRTMLRVPLHHKPPLLHPHAPSAHLREVQHGLLAQRVWPKYQVVQELFSFECVEHCAAAGAGAGAEGNRRTAAAATTIFERDQLGMVVLRSPSPLLVASLSARISNAFHLLRPTPAAVVSLVPRPYLEYSVGFFFSNLLRMNRRHGDSEAAPAAAAASCASDHPLLSHNAILPLLESLAQFDLSAGIAEQQQQAGSAGSASVAQGPRPSAMRRDQRVIKEQEMRDLLALHLTPSRSRAAGAPDSFPCVSELANPVGLLLAVYYFLYYNSLAFAVCWKVIPNVPHPPSEGESNNSGGGCGGSGGKDAEGGSGSNLSHTAPVPPFAPVFAANIGTASAVTPYPPGMLAGVPLRGLLIWLRGLCASLRGRGAQEPDAPPNSDVACSPSLAAPLALGEDPAATNAATLYAHLRRMLAKFFPEELVALDADAADGGDATGEEGTLDGQDGLAEGSFVALGLQLSATKAEPSRTDATVLPSPEELGRIAHRALGSLSTAGGGDEAPLLHALRQLQQRLRASQDHLAAFPSGSPSASAAHSLSSYGETFLLLVVRPLYRQGSRASGELLHAARDVWLRFHSSHLASSKFVHRTLLCMLDQTAPEAGQGQGQEQAEEEAEEPAQSWRRLESWLSHEEMLLDPYRLLLALPSHVLSRAGLVRLYLGCLYHALVGSAAFLAGVAKAEYVSGQLLRQARHQAAHAAWARAARLMAPPPNPHERRGASLKEVDPMLLAVHAHVDKAAHAIFASDAKQPVAPAAAHTAKKEGPVTPAVTPSPKDGAVTSADSDGKALKRCKTDSGTCSAPSGTSYSGPKREEAAADVRMKDEGAEEKGNAGADAAPSSATGAVAPRPFPFLVSDRVLTAGEQQVFSAEYVLAPPPSSGPAAPGPAPAPATAAVSTPTLRTFAYLLTTRVAVVQRLLTHAAELVRGVNSAATGQRKGGVATVGEGEGEPEECVSAIFAFLSLLLTASVPAASTSPSSLFLLLHVQTYPVELLPLFAAHFKSQMALLLEEGPLLHRIQAGVGDSHADPKAQAERAHFLQQLMQLKTSGKLA